MPSSTVTLPRERFPAHRDVFRHGDPGDCAYLVEEGRVAVMSTDGSTVAQLGVGALFGEVALLDLLPRTATVRTLEPTVLLRIEHEHVRELLQRADPVIRHLLTLLLQRFRSYHPPVIAGPVPSAPSDQEAAVRALMLTRDLAYALEHDQLEVYYQPLVGLSDRTLLGFEALARWRHPVLGMVLPDEFIGLAARTGLIRRLGQWVLEHAMQDWPRLKPRCRAGAGLRPFVSVNLSAGELTDPTLVSAVQERMAALGLQPQELKLELTETEIIQDRERVDSVLRQLSADGIAIALDDFGTGYGGLDYLKSLPVSCVKIDKTFVYGMHDSTRSAEIVQSALRLTTTLGLTSIAEGIEDERTASALAELGCSVGQGYFFGRPAPLHDLDHQLASAVDRGAIRS